MKLEQKKGFEAFPSDLKWSWVTKNWETPSWSLFVWFTALVGATEPPQLASLVPASNKCEEAGYLQSLWVIFILGLKA